VSLTPGTRLGACDVLAKARRRRDGRGRGRAADARSDVWAFGVVLFEMLAGQRVFRGDDIADTLAAVDDVALQHEQ
jgi:serine/threonine protein kinase